MTTNNQNSSIDSNYQPQVFPYVPPGDSIVKNELSISNLIESGSQNQEILTRFCGICDYPMIVKVVLLPCHHYMCYSCYCLSPNECKFCDQMIKEIKRLGDYESFHVCDQEKCFKYFENEAKYNSHIDQIHS